MTEREEQVDLSAGLADATAGIGWSPEANPVESFTSTIEHALQQLSLELAAIRAERDGLRLELEGLRAQYELMRNQLHDRDRFQATVRELGDIVRMLNVPASWTSAPAAPEPPQPAEQTVPLATAPQAAPPAAPAVPAPAAQAAPTFEPSAPTPAPPAPPVAPEAAPTEAAPAPTLDAPAAPWGYAVPPVSGVVPPVEPPASAADEAPATTEWAFAAPPADVPDPLSWAAATPDQAETDWSAYLGKPAGDAATSALWSDAAPEHVGPDSIPQAVWVPSASSPVAPPEPAAPDADEPVAAPSFAAPSFTVPTPEPQPEPTAEPQPEAPLHFVLPNQDAQPTTSLSSLDPGVWQLPEPSGERRRSMRPSTDGVLLWAKRAVAGIGMLLIVALLLVAVGPKVLPYQTFFVRSGSMEPTIEVGELIFLTKVDAADLSVGDIITFERPDRPGVMVTHRIHAVEQTDSGKVFQTKGDANGSPDTWRVPAQGEGWRYALGVPKVGFVFGYLNTPMARVGMLVIPAVILGLLSLIDIWKPSTASKSSSRRRR